jgi:hypothetical protein
MIDHDDRPWRLRTHRAQRFEHEGWPVSSRVRRPSLPPREARLDIVQAHDFVVAVRHDQARVLGARRVELQAEELNQTRDDPAGL